MGSPTTTVPGFCSALVTTLAGRSGLATVPVEYAWPGPNAAPEMIALDFKIDGHIEIAGFKAGRKNRKETYPVEVVVWVFDNSVGADGADVVDARAWALFAEVESALADDVSAGAASLISWASSGDFTRDLSPWPLKQPAGWACEIRLKLNVNARLS